MKTSHSQGLLPTSWELDFKKVKAAILEESKKGSVFAIFLRFSKRSQPNHKGYLDKRAFEAMIRALGFHTDYMKETILAETRTIFDKIYLTFDRDCDGFISSQDFVNTLKGLESETFMRA